MKEVSPVERNPLFSEREGLVSVIMFCEHVPYIGLFKYVEHLV